jgi:hypothetical protein
MGVVVCSERAQSRRVLFPSKKVGRPEWGAEPGKRYFVLTILSVKEE